MLGISKDMYTDLSTNKKKEDVYVRMYVNIRKSGIVAKLKPTNFTVLMMICTYMDEEGFCFPTQEQLAADCGLNKSTVNKAIKELLEIEFDGKPLISREIIQRGYFKNSVYKVNPISQVAIFNGQIEGVTDTNTSTATNGDTETKPDINNNTGTENNTNNDTSISTNINTFRIAKDVAEFYKNVYQEVYNVQPNINYQRDLSQVKKKWLGTYSDEQIATMIEVGVKEYDKRWKNPKYQRPTLAALVSWIGEQALGLASNNEKDFKEVSEMTSDYVAINDKALNRLANRLNK